MVANLCVSSPVSWSRSKIVGQFAWVFVVVWLGVGDVCLFSNLHCNTCHRTPKDCFFRIFRESCVTILALWETLLFKLFYLFLAKIKEAIRNSFIFNTTKMFFFVVLMHLKLQFPLAVSSAVCYRLQECRC